MGYWPSLLHLKSVFLADDLGAVVTVWNWQKGDRVTWLCQKEHTPERKPKTRLVFQVSQWFERCRRIMHAVTHMSLFSMQKNIDRGRRRRRV